MLADIIAIGDELMIGQVVDTNSSYIASELTKIGIKVRRKIAIPDRVQDITETLDASLAHSEIIIITGGLGPTNDDITKKTLTKYFKGKLVIHQPSLENIKNFFNQRGTILTERNRKQAEIPDNCTALINRNGTAPGMMFIQENHLIFSLPGVPFEMKALIIEEVLPIIKSKFDLPVIMHRTINTSGLTESITADMLKDWEEKLEHGIALAYLPSPGVLRFRLTIQGTSTNKKELEEILAGKTEELVSIIGIMHVFGFDEDTLQEVIGKKLRENQYSVSVAESITGGYISHLITSVAGASEYYMGGIVTYSNKSKIDLLNVQESSISEEGAVSKIVVEQMALGVQKKFNTTFGIATSGIAGPTGGTGTKPVGTTWIAIASPHEVISHKFLFGENRERNIMRAAINALNLLRNEIDRHIKNCR